MRLFLGNLIQCYEFMIEYIFFHQKTCDLFCQFLQQFQVAYKNDRETMSVGGFLVAVDENLPDELSNQIEDYYDDLMEMDENLVDEDPEDRMNQAGLAVRLNSGVSVFASVQPEVLNRMLTVVTRDEIAEFIDAIADAVENPDSRSLCQRKAL